MKEIKPPNPENNPEWSFLGTLIGYVHILEGGWEIEYATEAKGPWLGFVRLFENEHGILCREFDFFNKGIIFKIWGFEEDFKNKRERLVILHHGKWFFKEDADEFYYGARFAKNSSMVNLFWMELISKQEKKRVEVHYSP